MSCTVPPLMAQSVLSSLNPLSSPTLPTFLRPNSSFENTITNPNGLTNLLRFIPPLPLSPTALAPPPLPPLMSTSYNLKRAKPNAVWISLMVTLTLALVRVQAAKLFDPHHQLIHSVGLYKVLPVPRRPKRQQRGCLKMRTELLDLVVEVYQAPHLELGTRERPAGHMRILREVYEGGACPYSNQFSSLKSKLSEHLWWHLLPRMLVHQKPISHTLKYNQFCGPKLLGMKVVVSISKPEILQIRKGKMCFATLQTVNRGGWIICRKRLWRLLSRRIFVRRLARMVV